MGRRQVFSFTVLSGASTSDSVDLGGSPWRVVVAQVGTMSTGVQLMVQNSIDAGSTFYYLYNTPINSATVACATFSVVAGVGTNGGVVPLDAGACLNNIRFVGTGVVSGGISIKVICSD